MSSLFQRLLIPQVTPREAWPLTYLGELPKALGPFLLLIRVLGIGLHWGPISMSVQLSERKECHLMRDTKHPHLHPGESNFFQVPEVPTWLSNATRDREQSPRYSWEGEESKR